jgi:prepilin-type N-terminal cleavage/methylation domain-containing protein
MKKSGFPRRHRQEQGFSLIELLVAVSILLLIMAGVFSQVARLQQFSVSQDLRRDMFANGRQLLDQFDRDLRSAGYPNRNNFRTSGLTSYSFVTTSPVENNSNLSTKSLIFVSPTTVMFEGDMDGNGIVDSVAYQYSAAAPNGVTARCPCILRAEVPKVNGDPYAGQSTLNNLNVVLENVQAPGNNSPVFTFYDSSGVQQTPPSGGWTYDTAGAATQTIATLRMVKMTINMQGEYKDSYTKQFASASLTKLAYLRNHL